MNPLAEGMGPTLGAYLLRSDRVAITSLICLLSTIALSKPTFGQLRYTPEQRELGQGVTCQWSERSVLRCPSRLEV